MSRSWDGGSTSAWRRTRAFVIIRDKERGYGCRTHEEGWCARANAGEHTCTHRAELEGEHAGHAHHVYGREVTGDDPQYIRAACRACNLAIGDPSRPTDPPLEAVTRW